MAPAATISKHHGPGVFLLLCDGGESTSVILWF